MEVLDKIKRHGLSVHTLDGDLHVHPSHLITDAIRQTIKRHKDALVDFMETYEERAAIMEYDAGLPREEAQRLAYQDIMKGYGDE
ncbi:MAG: hypothetical protein COB36_14020 [Alphaproteobacteria bacterium]|nr:MAG: hypothetical protein COB36_14020 [Alphaproteobacteria bacterium]